MVEKPTSEPAVSVIVPCRNEVGHIEALLGCLAAQQEPPGGVEFIIADGMSEDGTRQRLQRQQLQHPHIRIIDNPEEIVSTALNRAIEASRGDIVIRMDAHTEYAADYLRQCVAALKATGADNVGGPWRAAGQTYRQRAIALAFQSRFASGGAASRALDYEGAVDTVYLGCWRKHTLLQLGGFDEELIRNQDDELNLRIVRAGGVVWQTPKIRSTYHPRSSLGVLFNQYAQYGYWKVRVIRKHRLPAALRHLVPGAFVAAMLTLTVLSPFSWLARLGWLFIAGTYLSAAALAALAICSSRERWRYLPVMPLVFAAYHFGYGYGFLRGVLDFVVLNRGSAKRFTTLTRQHSRTTL